MIKRIGLWFQKNPETIPLGIGVLCLLAAVALLVNPARLVMQGKSAEGVVIDVVNRPVRDSQGKDHVQYTATIRYRAGDRNMTIQRSWQQDTYSYFFCISGCYSKGEELKMRYLADDPEIVAVDSFLGLFGGSLTLGLIGAMALFFWRLWRSERSQNSSAANPADDPALDCITKQFAAFDRTVGSDSRVAKILVCVFVLLMVALFIAKSEGYLP